MALVLSGGGALGIAHVGVLRVLERLHVPIDCIAGTSMGAIIGGLYAAGYSPDELEHLVRTLDWNALIRDVPDRRRVPFRRKIDDLGYTTRFELGVSRHGFLLPEALVVGHRLGATLRLLGLRAAGIDDFDRLPVQFRAVAADVTTGETVVLDHGELAAALRASMAVPGLFAPVEVDGRLLVDGGIVANLPVDVVRDLGAERVVAVDLGKPLASRQRPQGMPGVISQALDVLSRREVERALAGVDVLVVPPVADWGLLDFQAGDELMACGAAAAEEQAAALAPLAVDDAPWQSYLARQRRATPSIQLRSVAIDPGPGLSPGTVSRAVRSRPGRVLDEGGLAADLERLWESGEFQSVDFGLERAPGDAWDLEIHGHRKAWGPNYLRSGLALSSDLEGASSFNLLAALTMTRLDRLNGELKLAAQMGEKPIVSVELYQPVAASQVPFVAVGVIGSSTKTQIALAPGPVQYRFAERRVALDLGLALGRYGELRAGLRRDDTTGRASGSGSHGAPHFDRTDAGVRLNLLIDQLDRVNFPRQGLLLSSELYEARSGLGADDAYRRFDLQAVAAGTVGRHTLLALVHGSSALGGTLPAAERVYLGGLFNLSGLPPGEVSGSYGGVASLLYLYRLGRLPKFGEGLYVGVSAEAGNAWERAADVSASDLRYAFAVTFGADTFIGPVYLSQGWTTDGKDSLYLYIGRTF